MWVFTDRGFYSVVHRDEKTFSVRARSKADLLALREFIPDLKVIKLKGRDYQFRAYVAKADWMNAMLAMTGGIDYGNFKSAVEKRQGKRRSSIYHDIWFAALEIGFNSTIWNRDRHSSLL